MVRIHEQIFYAENLAELPRESDPLITHKQAHINTKYKSVGQVRTPLK